MVKGLKKAFFLRGAAHCLKHLITNCMFVVATKSRFSALGYTEKGGLPRCTPAFFSGLENGSTQYAKNYSERSTTEPVYPEWHHIRLIYV